MNATYEDLLQDAQRKSLGGRWAAVVDITTYMSATSRTTVAVSSAGPISSHSRSGEFRGVVAQFHDGVGMYSTPQGPAAVPSDSDELPF
jgi:hypothetical protein